MYDVFFYISYKNVMGRGKRYNDEQKLNVKKVFAVILVILVIVMFFIGIKKLLKKEEKVVSYFTDISYFSIYENGKWGVINSKGDYVIKPEYDEMITIPDNKKAIFICTYEVDYNNNTYKTKVINANNEQLYTSYNSIEVLSNYDENNNVWNEENVLKVEKDGKYGLIDLNGTEILSCNNEKIEALKGVKNSILVQKDGLFGLVNNRGERIIDNKYASIEPLTNEYTNGYIVKSSDSKYGVISAMKEQVFECKYSEIKHLFGNDLYVVKENDKWKITNKSGDKQIELSSGDITYLNSDIFIAKSNGKYGIYSMDKTEKVKPEYQNIIYAFSDNYIAIKDNKYGVINSSGEVLVQFDYDSLAFNKDADCLFGNKKDDENTYLIDRNLALKVIGKNITVHDGYIRAMVDNEYKFYDLKFEEKNNREVFPNNTLFVAKNDGKYGLVNKDGTLVVQYQYEDITGQNEYGYVAVKKDGKWGIIDQYGNISVDPKYEFSDISKITFIGKWHSIENINMGTYLIY